ncbi:MAG: MnhB domain-containing protein [Chloroflexi bacterium]|nr:MnhB domain-containing protein [Chloroflexota bacterium]
MSSIIGVVAPRLLGPALILAAAIIVKGYADVGDGFSAGVIVATALALRYVSLGWELAERSLPVLRRAPQVATAGLLIALATGFAGPLVGDPPFTHYPRAGESVIHIGTLELITAVVFDLGLFLFVTAAFVVLIHHLARLAQGGPR